MEAAQFPTFGPASVGMFEAILSAVSAALYLLIACAALLRAPRDSRARLFLLIAITNLAPYLIPVLFWSRGQVAFSKPVTVFKAVLLPAPFEPMRPVTPGRV